MKATHKSENIHVSFSTLYLDDLEQILHILMQNCEGITVEGDGFIIEEIENIDEYKNLAPAQFKSIKISTTQPMLSIDFDGWRGVHLLAYKNDVKSVGVITSIKSILQKHERKAGKIINNIYFFIITSILSLPVLFYLGLKNHNPNLQYLVWAWGFIWWWSANLTYCKKELLYRSIYFHTETTFFSRNKDKIILTGLSAVAGYLFAKLSVLIDMIFK